MLPMAARWICRKATAKRILGARWRPNPVPTTSKSSRSLCVSPPRPRSSTADREAYGDEYRWMQDINSEEVLRHLDHENLYADASLTPLHHRAEELHGCMIDRQPEEEGGDRRSVPERLGGFLYYTRRDEEKAFPVYVRRPVEGKLDDEQVVLDLNEIEEHGILGGVGGNSDNFGYGVVTEEDDIEQCPPAPALGCMKLSPDQRMLACTIDAKGNDRFMLALFDLSGGGSGGGGSGSDALGRSSTGTAITLRDDAMWDDVVGVEWGASWAATPDTEDSRSPDENNRNRCYELFYTVPDELRRPWQVRSVVLRPRLDKKTVTCRENNAKPVDGNQNNVDQPWTVDCASDRIVFEETDDAFFADVGKTKDDAFVVINVHSKTTSEVHLLPKTRPAPISKRTAGPNADAARSSAVRRDGKVGNGRTSDDSSRHSQGPVLLRRRRQGEEYYVDHCGNAFYLITNSSPSSSSEGGGCVAESGDEAVVRMVEAGEYRLVRVPQPRGDDAALIGIADVPWEAVPYGTGISPSSSTAGSSARREGPGDGSLSLGNGARGDDAAADGSLPESSSISGSQEKSSDSSDGGEGSGRIRGMIQEMDLFKDHCVLYESCPNTASPRLKVIPLASPDREAFLLTPPAPGGCHGRATSDSGGSDSSPEGGINEGAGVSTAASTVRPGVNSWFEARTVRFSVSSPTAPEDVYDLCLESGKLDLLRRTEVPGSPPFDGSEYRCYSVQVATCDGEMVPLTIAHRTGLKLDGSNRLLLHGYGSYGMTLPLDYQPENACMLERGWVLAFAHVRGGGERGKAWHAGGRGLHKWNSFRDFEACAEHLVSAGFTQPSRMGVHVSSAGGLLGGVMANTRPDLFSAMVMKTPFLGVLSAMQDTSLPLTVHEFDEWGDPNASEAVEAMIRSYCPYENVREQKFPAMLISASVNDNRVNFWDPTKWVARVRAANVGDAPVLLRVSNSDGHHGPDNTLDRLRDAALDMAFLERHL